MSHKLLNAFLFFSLICVSSYATDYSYSVDSKTSAEQGTVNERYLASEGRYLLTATPATGYKFLRWSDGTTNNPHVIELTEQTFGADDKFSINAVFGKESCSFTEKYKSTCPGSVTSEFIGDACHCTYSLSAVPSTGYEFIGWSDGNKDNPRIVSLDLIGNRVAYVARFLQIQCNYNETISSCEQGSVTSVKDESGCAYTVTAVPTSGYHFVKWSDGNTENPRTILLDGDTETFQAYFQAPERSVIKWQGSSEGNETSWNDRGNWLARDGENWVPLTCLNPLSSDLKVIIPEGLDNYPVIPDEITEFGLKTEDDKYTDSFYIEYGGAIKGVENLTQENQKLYTSAETEFVASRKEWILVGTVVQPFEDGSTTEVRNMRSGDFYIEAQKPHVYMHQALLDGSTVNWDKEFSDIYVPVPADKVFAIHIPDMYGPYKLTAQMHYTYFEPNPSMTGDGSNPKRYTFTGRFYNDASMTTYSGLTPDAANLICNTYPCNLDPSKIADNVQVFHYSQEGTATGSFGVWQVGDVIKPQHGFIYTAGEETTFTVTDDMLTEGGTKYKSVEASKPAIYLQVNNMESQLNEGSYVALRHDPLVGGTKPDFHTDAPKMFVSTASVPELYINRYESKWAGVCIPDAEAIIPLGLKLRDNMSVRFSLASVEGFEEVTLEDSKTGVSYDMLEEESVEIANLKSGDIDDRFFLNVVKDKDVPTSVGENNDGSIQIFVGDDGIHIYSSASEILNEAEIISMAGESVTYKLSGNNAIIKKPVTSGVYVVKVFGNVGTKVVKFIIK